MSVTKALSPTEEETFHLLGLGKTTKWIAHARRRSVKTIDATIEHIKTKLGVRHRGELVVMACEQRVRREILKEAE